MHDKKITEAYVIERKIELFQHVNVYLDYLHKDIIEDKIKQLRRQLQEINTYNKYPFLKYFNMRKIKKRILRILNLK